MNPSLSRWMMQSGALVLIVSLRTSAGEIGTAFTYQGHLQDDGVPANGEYDMWFSLFDAASGGMRVAGPLFFDGGGGNRAQVEVVNGYFQVDLQFERSFDDTAVWLQIESRPHAIGAVVALTPRQALNATPYAQYALDGPGVGLWAMQGDNLHNVSHGNVGIGTDNPTSRLHVNGDITSAGGVLQAVCPSDGLSSVFLGWASDASGDEMARIRIAGNGVGAGNGLDIQKTGDRSLMRIYNSGDAWLRGGIDVSGDTVVRGALDVGLESVLSTESSFGFAEALCPEGKRVITGGCACTCPTTVTPFLCFPDGRLFGSAPRTDGTGWSCGCSSGNTTVAVAYAVCGRIR